MMKIALLDFDDVLFDTSAFSVASRKVFIDSGVSEKEHDEFYQQSLNELSTTLASQQSQQEDFQQEKK